MGYKVRKGKRPKSKGKRESGEGGIPPERLKIPSWMVGG
jgi:hypothetical protein